MKILIVEDEPKTGEYLRQGLSEAGYVADLVPHGTDGLHMALHGAYDLVILDVMLPGLNGWQVLQSLRERGLQMPVLFLTARDQVEDRVKGLELGADDYLVKPFSFAELLARVRIILRRSGAGSAAPPGLAQRQACGPDSQGVRPAGTSHASPRRGVATLPDRFAGVGHELRQRHQRHRGGDAPPARED